MTTPTLVTADNRFLEYEVALTVEAGAYSAGDLVCAKITLENIVSAAKRNAVVLRDVLIHDNANQSTVDYDVVFFDADPSGTTFTLNSALDVADTDIAKVCGLAQVTVSAIMSDNCFLAATPGIRLVPSAGTSLYAAIIARTNAPTYAATTDLSIRLLFERA